MKNALLIVTDGEGIGISRRKVTISTSGVVPLIERAGEVDGVLTGQAVRDQQRRLLLSAFAHGEQGAADELIPLVYEELRRIAHRRRGRARRIVGRIGQGPPSR